MIISDPKSKGSLRASMIPFKRRGFVVKLKGIRSSSIRVTSQFHLPHPMDSGIGSSRTSRRLNFEMRETVFSSQDHDLVQRF